MGDLGTQLFAAGLRSLGINAFAMPEATMDTLKKGRAHTNGKECLPFILCVGHLFEYLERYWDGKKCVAFFVNESGGPCRLGQYNVLLKQIIRGKRLRNVTTLSLSNEDAYAGLGPVFAMMAWETITLSDVLGDVRSGIMTNALSPDTGIKIFNEEFKKILAATEKGTGKVYKPLKQMAFRLKHLIPAKRKIEESRFISLCGEVYVRRDGFSHKWLNDWFAKRGFIIKNAYVIEFILYLEWLIKKKLLEPHRSPAAFIEMVVRHFYMDHVEKKMKRICAGSGYYKFERTKIGPLIRHSEHILPREHKGETGLTIGVGMYETIEKLAGVINIGPFGCMPTRLTEGLIIPEMTIRNKKEVMARFDKNYNLPDYFTDDMNIPFLSIETDGNVYPQVIESRLETFLMQAERMASLIERARREKKAEK
jgi:predicted nucleotide-binding protein (sugar kinase/HSP70/actin superfamily)